jgi:hypothetical protein
MSYTHAGREIHAALAKRATIESAELLAVVRRLAGVR